MGWPYRRTVFTKCNRSAGHQRHMMLRNQVASGSRTTEQLECYGVELHASSTGEGQAWAQGGMAGRRASEGRVAAS